VVGWGVRLAWLRVMLAGLPAGRRRRAVEREVARLERVRALLSDPELMEDRAVSGDRGGGGGAGS
jgi:hypothetical protein